MKTADITQRKKEKSLSDLPVLSIKQALILSCLSFNAGIFLAIGFLQHLQKYL